eukprot:TRINITY_DN11104_c0_g1_i1.p1 TRINITY_DN11104_c0_g1~~TRINITY_DN11104_c0_g1_i1.p1  ORF type:complete len:854 (+),score=210.02 TRINITY_DN11104_c0_g1_i1:167-2728(+)
MEGVPTAAPSTAMMAQNELSDDHKRQLDELIQSIQRDINCTSDEDRNTRKAAVKALHVALFGGIAVSNISPVHDAAVTNAAFAHLLKPLLRLYADQTEKVRELSIDLVTKCLKLSPQGYLPYYVPVLVGRIGNKQVLETTEELRLELMQQVEHVVNTQAGGDLGTYIEEWLQVFAKMVADDFAEVKRMSARCTVLLARKTPERFHMASGVMVTPLVAALAHQHAKVRSVALRALGAVIQYGEAKHLDEIRLPLAQKSLDHSPTVRKSLYTIAGRWLVDMRDRYSYWHKILPLLLPGELDDVAELQTLAKEAFVKAGLQYEQENEERLKDQLDFGGWTPESEIPPLGCRELVKECFGKLYPGLLKDMVDWTADTRRQSARLMLTLLRYERDNTTMHLQKVTTGLAAAALDEEADIAQLVVTCAETIGAHVALEACCAAVLPPLKDTGSSSRSVTAHLILLAAMIRGSTVEQVQTCASSIVNALHDRNVREAETHLVQEELVLTVADLIGKLGSACGEHSQPLFTVLTSMLALAPSIASETYEALDRLAAAQSLTNRQALFEKHTEPLLDALAPDHKAWSVHSPQRKVFDALLLHAGAVLGRLLDRFVPIFVSNTQPEKPVEVRVQFFTLLGKLLTSAQSSINSTGALDTQTVTIIRNIVCPNLVWTAGDKAQALRVAALSCLWALLRTEVVSHDHILAVASELVPLLTTTMEDKATTARLLTVRVFEEVFRLHGQLFTASYETYDQLHKLYPELLRRMDDSDNDVRLMTCRAFEAYGAIMMDKYDTELYKAHTSGILRGLLVHLDDPDSNVQDAVEKALAVAIKINPPLSQECIEAVLSRHRSPLRCERLLSIL